MVYRLNAILPGDICIRGIYPMPDGAHCRFDAESREYRYYIYGKKDPFRADRAYFYPYPLDWEVLEEVSRPVEGLHRFYEFFKEEYPGKPFPVQHI